MITTNLKQQHIEELKQIQIDDVKRDLEEIKYEPPTTLLRGLTKTNPVNQVLVGIIGIEDYLPETKLDTLDNVKGDIGKSIQLWNTFLGYKTLVLSGENEKNTRNNKYIYEQDVIHFLARVHTDYSQYKDEYEETFKYNALIMVILGHGCKESLITSEGGLISFDYIRHLGGNILDTELTAHTIRLFIIDVCRGGSYSVIQKIKRRTRGINEINEWKPTHVNAQSNICTLYSVPKGFAAPDENVFVDTIEETVKNIQQLDKYTVDEICMKISQEICKKSVAYWCPEYVSHNKFKIKLQKKIKKGKLKYYEVKEKDNEQVKRIFGVVSEDDEEKKIGTVEWLSSDNKNKLIVGALLIIVGYGLYRYWKANSLSRYMKSVMRH